jgi:hypothetical protein
MAQDRKSVLLRLDPALYQALASWAGAELRSVNAQVEWILRESLRQHDRLPDNVRPSRRPGRPRQDDGSASAD